MTKNPFRYFKTSPEIIQLGVMMYVRFPLSLRNVEDLLHERGIDVCHESVRLRVDRFGTYFAHKIRKCRSESMRRSPQWRWHLDEVFVKIRGEKRRRVRISLTPPLGANGARKLGVISITAPKIRTYRSEGASGRCLDSGACEVCRSSSRSIRQCTITSASKGISTPESGSNKSETPRFASGATFSSPSTCCPAKTETGSH